MNYIPRPKFSLLNDPHATLILGMSNQRLSLSEAKEKGLDFLRSFRIPGLDNETLWYVAWCPDDVTTVYKTYLIYCIGLLLHYQIVAHWERQPFFLDLIRCKGLLTWNRHSVLALQKFYMAVSILSSEEKALLDLFCH